ncbi:MAG: insulinase family protein [Bacteroidetes bacterium]|nr:MAG: insulinase family protein [Bacteroidota bacterium]
MLEYTKFRLANGLRVIHHFDPQTPLAVVNILYNVGARDEDPDYTGMAHLFEHLMFSGSAHAESYDEPLQKASGENNAFTSNDITNYYVTLPAENIETALWLESDRMFQLNLNENSMKVQQSVVIEEFKQRYLNQPYGDLWALIRELAYKEHPYQWATIGKEIGHIEKVDLEVLRSFYQRFYNPSNAILVMAGNIPEFQCKALAEKWFLDIPSGEANLNNYTVEPKQTELRRLTVEREVPMDCLTLAFHGPRRTASDFYACDLLMDVLGGSPSSRLYQSLIKELEIFADIGAYTTESIDEGLLLISGRILPGKTLEEAEEAVMKIVNEVLENGIQKSEWEKVCNKKRTVLNYQELEVLNKAMNLAMFENLGDADLVNSEEAKFLATSTESLHAAAKDYLQMSNCSILYYVAKK